MYNKGGGRVVGVGEWEWEWGGGVGGGERGD